MCTFIGIVLKKNKYVLQIDGLSLRKHAYIVLTPLQSHFYTVKLGFARVCISFLILAQKHRLWVLVRTDSPRRF